MKDEPAGIRPSFPFPVFSVPPEGGAAEEGPSYLPLPRDMSVYHPPPLPDPARAACFDRALAMLGRLGEALETALAHPDLAFKGIGIDLGTLDRDGLAFLAEVLGEGEVSARVVGDAGDSVVQETVLAGVFRVHGPEGDSWEVGEIPRRIREEGEAGWSPASFHPEAGRLEQSPMARAILGEVLKNAEDPGRQGHVVSLSTLPLPPSEYQALESVLGDPRVVILSRGYGNCRIHSTVLRNVWWVRHFNSEDRVILDTLESGPVPAAARAAREDLEDSLLRLSEIRDWLEKDAPEEESGE